MKHTHLSRFSPNWMTAIAIGFGVVAGPGQALATQPIGVDVSSYQGGSINWSSVKSAGYTFAWAKATEGTYYIDADFTVNEANAHAAGVDIGAYHFARPDEDVNESGADSEASYFWNEAKNYLSGGNGYLVPMLDFETSYSTGTYMSDWINYWCTDVKNYASANGANCNPVVYTDGSIASSLTSTATAWPLDIADPGYTDPQGDNPSVGLGPWSTWTFWQYSWTGSVSGISGQVDEDIIDGTSTTLAAFVISTSGTTAGPGVSLDWNKNNGGTGTWNNSTANWLLSGTGDVAWNSGGDYANFGQTAGTVTLGTATEADGLAFNTAGYVITGTSETLTLNSPANINVPAGTPTYIECVLAGVGYNLSGGGVLVLNNANNGSGSGTSAEFISGPGTTLVVASDHDVGNSGVTLNLENGGIYQNNDSTSGDQFLLSTVDASYASAIALETGGGYFDNPNANLTMSDYITGPGSLTTLGTTFTLTLSYANTYTGITTIQSGLLAISADNNLGTAPSSAVANQLTLNCSTPSNGLRVTSSFTMNAKRGITLASGNTGCIHAASGDTLTLPCVITGSGNFVSGSSVTVGYGTIKVSGANTYTGTTTVAAGTLQLGANGTLPSGTAVTIAADDSVGSLFDLNGYSQTIGPLASSTGVGGTGTKTPTVNLTGALTVDETSASTFGGVISGSGGSLTVTGTSELTLTGVNTYSGNTTVEGGATLGITADSGLGATSETLTLNGGCLKNNNSAPTLSSSRTISLGTSGGYIDAGWAPSEPVTIDSKITGSGPLLIDMDGSPVVLVNTANNYTGETDIGTNGPGYYASGTQAWLKLGASGVLPNGSGYGYVVIHGAYNGLLDLAGFTQTINGLSGDGTVNNSTGSGSLSVGNNNSTSAFSGVIENTSGTLTLTKVGTGTLTLSGANTYSGNTTISAGTLALGSAGSINNTAKISVAAGATFDVSAIASYTLGSSTSITASGTSSAATIKGGTTVSLGSRPITLTYDGSHPALTISQGTLSLNGNAFTINGTQLAGGHTYTIVQQTSGNITSSGSYSVTGTAIGAAGTTAAISVSGGNVILTITDTTTTTINTLTPSTYGQPATLSATVAPSPSGGTVQFYDNSVALGSPITVSSGMASYTTNTLSVGSHPITASYSGITGYAASSTTSSSNQQVNLPPNSTPVNITNVSILSNGTLEMNFAGVAGYTYLIQTTTNLLPPITWSNISTNTADINGMFNFNDLNSTNYTDRYYQTEVQP